VNPIDIRDLASNLDSLIGGLDDHTTRGPLLVTRDGEPEAVIIRHKAYAPRLHHFEVLPNGKIACGICPNMTILVERPNHLGAAVEAANAHWREQHRNKP
jgi:hypothetical protein